MRWLMPLQDRWFYGDSLFIVDPWLYLILGLGLYLAGRSRRAGRSDPARPLRIALAAGSVYVGGMIAGTTFGRALAGRSLGNVDPGRLMVTALPVTPFRKQLIADDGGRYRIGTVDLLTRTTRVDAILTRSPRFAEAVRALEQSREGRALLGWSRFPAVRELGDGRLRFFDLRYSDGREPSWAGLDVTPVVPSPVPKPTPP
jgi:inner membrane protein